MRGRLDSRAVYLCASVQMPAYRGDEARSQLGRVGYLLERPGAARHRKWLRQRADAEGHEGRSGLIPLPQGKDAGVFRGKDASARNVETCGE